MRTPDEPTESGKANRIPFPAICDEQQSETRRRSSPGQTPLARCPLFERLLVTLIDAWAVGYLPSFASLKQIHASTLILALAQLPDLNGSHTGRGVLNVI